MRLKIIMSIFLVQLKAKPFNERRFLLCHTQKILGFVHFDATFSLKINF